MPNLNTIILTAADYKVALSVPGSGVFILRTAESISWNHATENELIYAVGDVNAIGNKQNATKYSGKFTIQAGEMELILLATGLKSAIQIPNATLSIVATGSTLSKTYTGMCINTEDISLKAKDKQSMVNLDWTAINIF